MLPSFNADAPFEWSKEETRLDQEELIKEEDVVEGGVLNFGSPSSGHG